MTTAERQELRLRLSWLRPKMHVELPVALVRELLDDADCERLCEACEAALDDDPRFVAREGAP